MARAVCGAQGWEEAGRVPETHSPRPRCWRLWGRGLQFPFHCLAWVSCLFCFARFDLYNLFSAQASFRSYLRWHLNCICILKTHHPGPTLLSLERTWFPPRKLVCFPPWPWSPLLLCLWIAVWNGARPWKSLLHLYVPCMLCMGYEEPCSYYSRVHLRLFCDRVGKDGHRQPMLPGNHSAVSGCRLWPFRRRGLFPVEHFLSSFS